MIIKSVRTLSRPDNILRLTNNSSNTMKVYAAVLLIASMAQALHVRQADYDYYEGDELFTTGLEETSENVDMDEAIRKAQVAAESSQQAVASGREQMQQAFATGSKYRTQSWQKLQSLMEKAETLVNKNDATAQEQLKNIEAQIQFYTNQALTELKAHNEPEAQQVAANIQNASLLHQQAIAHSQVEFNEIAKATQIKAKVTSVHVDTSMMEGYQKDAIAGQQLVNKGRTMLAEAQANRQSMGTQAYNQMVQAAQEAIAQGNKAIEKANLNLQSWNSASQSRVSDLQQQMQNQVGSNVVNARKVMNNVANNWVTNINTAAQQYHQQAQEALNTASQSAQNMYNNARQMAQQVQQMANGAMQQGMTSAVNGLANMQQGFGNVMNNMQQGMDTAMGGMNTAMNTASNMVSSFGNMFSSFIPQFSFG